MMAHALLTASLIGILALTTVAVADRIGAARKNAGLALLWLMLAAVWLKASIASSAWVLVPDRVLYDDAARYFREIRSIAEDPFAWNPFTGEGSMGYQESAKLGMSYVYGIILGLFATPTLYGVVALNVFFSSLGALLVGYMTWWLVGSSTPAVLSFIFASLHPECLFWIIRPARENLTLWLVPLLLFSAMRCADTGLLRHALTFLFAFVLILLTRVQLIAFGLIAPAFLLFAAFWMQRGGVARLAIISGGVIMGATLYVIWPLIEIQIARAVGKGFLLLVTIDPEFWISKVEHLDPRVLTLTAQGYGGLGVLLMPFVGLGALFTLAAVLWWGQIFPRGRRRHAALLVISIAAFLLGMAVTGNVNIRFRATIAPLLSILAAAGAWHLWRWLPLPPITLTDRGSRGG